MADCRDCAGSDGLQRPAEAADSTPTCANEDAASASLVSREGDADVQIMSTPVAGLVNAAHNEASGTVEKVVEMSTSTVEDSAVADIVDSVSALVVEQGPADGQPAGGGVDAVEATAVGREATTTELDDSGSVTFDALHSGSSPSVTIPVAVSPAEMAVPALSTSSQPSLAEQHPVAPPSALIAAPAPVPPLVMGQAGWEKFADRPPQKLPIRFKDCVGRTFLFPWKKAKTWKGVKGLINAAFLHIDIIERHVLAGRYDLMAHGMWTSGDSAAINPDLTSYQHMTSQLGASSSSESATVATAEPAPPPAPGGIGGTFLTHGELSRSAIILPQLWEDIIEPGMLVSMHMWPFNRPVDNIAQDNVNHNPHLHHHPPVTVPPPPPPPQLHPMGMGRGSHPPPVPAWIHRSRGPPILIDIGPGPRRKTRKRQEGT